MSGTAAEYASIVDDAWIECARHPHRNGNPKAGPLPPRLWEKLRLRLQTEYRVATGETDAVLLVEAP